MEKMNRFPVCKRCKERRATIINPKTQQYELCADCYVKALQTRYAQD